jgi:hypothetical protein
MSSGSATLMAAPNFEIPEGRRMTTSSAGELVSAAT